MQNTIIIAVDGLIMASWLFLVSAGLTFTYGVLRILNVAHGAFYTLGAYMAAYLVSYYLRTGNNIYFTYLLLFGAAVLIGFTVGPIIERVILRRIYRREEHIQILVTFAIFLILDDLTKMVWGVSPYFTQEPYTFLGQIQVGGITYTLYSFLLMGVSIATGILLWVIINWTRSGKIITAVITDREMCTALGINVPMIYTLSFAVGTMLAALGGALTAPMISVVPGIGVEVIVLSFAVVAIGGMGSVVGAAIGSLMVGIARSVAIHVFPELDVFAIYLVMALVLIFRTRGLIGELEVRKI